MCSKRPGREALISILNLDIWNPFLNIQLRDLSRPAGLSTKDNLISPTATAIRVLHKARRDAKLESLLTSATGPTQTQFLVVRWSIQTQVADVC